MSAPQGATSVATSHADAIVASQGSAAPTSGTSTIRAAIVSLGGEMFSIDLGMPSGLIGVTNLRGSVVPLIDLRQMIGVAAETALKYAVVVKHGNWQVGVLVDTVPEIRTLSKDQFLPAPVGTGDGVNPFVSTVVKLEDRLRGVLETSAILSHFEGTG
jgi:purine-binding chemotaxis protein CheW